jgi:subtilisin family serine protease
MERVKVLITSLILIGSFCESYADVGQKFPRKIKVAIIDTGIDQLMMNSSSLCETGHKDFTGAGLADHHGHGTHISGIVDQYSKNFIPEPTSSNKDNLELIASNYCQIIIKFFDSPSYKTNALNNTIMAFRWAINQNVDIINYSGGGTTFSKEERDIVVEALNKGIKVVAAAGNEKSNIDKIKYFPAMYDKRIFIVGNLVDNYSRSIAASSNYGKSVNSWEVGANVFSRLPNKAWGFMSGTSQATAVKTGKLIREMLSKN